MTETAYAKINLALHVLRRRDDGYHELQTLFAFVDRGDGLTAHAAEQDKLIVTGEFGSALTNPFDNIVAKALGKLPRSKGLRVALEKNLPVAAGLGGGSTDAGAIFRIVRAMHGLPDDWHSRAAALGADVPACVDSVACIGRGTGADIEPIDNDWAGKSVLLVNPRIPLSTGPVFKAWDGRDRGAMHVGPVSAIALNGRNDLEAPAIGLCPEIAVVIKALAATEALLARMSGSGATCFAIYDTQGQMGAAAARIAVDHPQWWQMSGKLR